MAKNIATKILEQTMVRGQQVLTLNKDDLLFLFLCFMILLTIKFVLFCGVNKQYI